MSRTIIGRPTRLRAAIRTLVEQEVGPALERVLAPLLALAPKGYRRSAKRAGSHLSKPRKQYVGRKRA